MGRPRFIVWVVTVVVVLHLLPEALAEGQLVGHAELIRSGHRAAIRNTDDLMALLADDTTHPTRPFQQENPS